MFQQKRHKKSHHPVLLVSPGDSGAAQEAWSVHRGRVQEAVQQQEHEGHQRAAQQWCGGGLGGPTGVSACWTSQGMLLSVFHHILAKQWLLMANY